MQQYSFELLSTPEPHALSKSNNKEEELSISEAGNFVLGDSRTLIDNSLVDKFNISAKPQALPNLKRNFSAVPPCLWKRFKA